MTRSREKFLPEVRSRRRGDVGADQLGWVAIEPEARADAPHWPRRLLMHGMLTHEMAGVPAISWESLVLVVGRAEELLSR